MNPRQFNQVINILRARESVDQYTGQKLTDPQPYHRKIPARREGASGGSTARGMQVDETVTNIFTIRWIADIQTTDIIEDQDKKKHEITHLDNLEGKNRELAIHTRGPV